MSRKPLKILMTDKCTLKCEYCCNKSTVKDRDTGSDINVKELLRWASCPSWAFLYSAIVNTNEVHLTGGEPLLELAKIYHLVYQALLPRRALSPDFKIYLYTNGTLIRDSASMRSQVRPLLEICDGISVGIHHVQAHPEPIINAICEAYPDLIHKFRFLYQDRFPMPKWRGLQFIPWTLNECSVEKYSFLRAPLWPI